MEKGQQSRAIDLKAFHAGDGFWKEEMELVRKEVIPYQWEILNDRVEGAAPSFCMRNFKVAGRMMKETRENRGYVPPKYTFRGFEALPEDPKHLEEDKFYGFVFQDSDFSKWIEAVAYSLVNHPDKELEKTADEAIDIVCAAQMENGYLDTYYIINGMDQAFSCTKDHHELYCFGHLTEGAVAYYQATGKDKLLKAVERFADYICSVFGREEGKRRGYPGHEIAEMALVRLYEATGKETYLDLARYFIDERGQKPYYWFGEDNNEPRTEGDHFMYYQAHKPVREQEEAIGHAVRAVYLYSGMTDVAGRMGDESLWNAVTRLWDSAVNKQMYITGGIGGTSIGESFSYEYDLPNDLAYAESCASVGLIFWARRMLEIDPDSKYADAMELALYNTVLSGMALDGKSFFYVNPLEVVPRDCKLDLRKAHVKPVRQKWFGCACCPPNIARLISSVPSYAFTESADTLFLHLHMSGTVEKKVGDTTAQFKITSALPWNGHVEIAYTGEAAAEMTLAVRIPSWAKNSKVSGAENMVSEVKKGYDYITGKFDKGTTLVFDFPMEAAMVEADSRVREDEGKVAFTKGPVTFCAEGIDNGEDLHLLRVLPNEAVTEGTTVIGGETFPVLYVKAVREEPRLTQGGLYRAYQPKKYKPVTLTLIPYYAWANRGENEMRVWLNVKEG